MVGRSGDEGLRSSIDRVADPTGDLVVGWWPTFLVAARRLRALLFRDVQLERVEERGVHVLGRLVVLAHRDHDLVGRPMPTRPSQGHRSHSIPRPRSSGTTIHVYRPVKENE